MRRECHYASLYVRAEFANKNMGDFACRSCGTPLHATARDHPRRLRRRVGESMEFTTADEFLSVLFDDRLCLLDGGS